MIPDGACTFGMHRGSNRKLEVQEMPSERRVPLFAAVTKWDTRYGVILFPYEKPSVIP